MDNQCNEAIRLAVNISSYSFYCRSQTAYDKLKHEGIVLRRVIYYGKFQRKITRCIIREFLAKQSIQHSVVSPIHVLLNTD